MNGTLRQIRVLLMVSTLFRLAVPVDAQQLPWNTESMVVDVAGRAERYTLPVHPPVEVWKMVAEGQGAPRGEGAIAPLGKVTYVAHLLVHRGIAGELLSLTDGIGAFTDTKGDGMFVKFSGLFGSATAATPSVHPFRGAFAITGGQGRFAGVIGSGEFTGVVDLRTGTFTGRWLKTYICPSDN